MHVKPTDRHRYLHYTSAHPSHTKRSIILRLSRICFYKNYFEKYLHKINSWFRVRGSADNFVKRQVLMPMGSSGLNIEDSIWVLPFDNIEVCTFYSAYNGLLEWLVFPDCSYGRWICLVIVLLILVSLFWLLLLVLLPWLLFYCYYCCR